MTAHALVEERQRCLKAGMNDHVTKPIDPDALFAALKRTAKPARTPVTAVSGKPVPSASEVTLPAIEGVDVEGGLKRVAGNKRLFRSLLEEFASNQGDAATQIAAALRSGDLTLAGRIAHTVKGVAGNLGITSIQAAAAGLEHAIRETDRSALVLAAEFESNLGVMVRAIRRALAEASPAEVPTKPDVPLAPEAASAAVMRLRALLEARDGDAADAFPPVEDVLAGMVEKSRLDALRDTLGDFDFDAALARLDEITAQCGVSP